MGKWATRSCPCNARTPSRLPGHLDSDHRVRWVTAMCSGDIVRTGGTPTRRSSACSRCWRWSSSLSRLCQQKERTLLRLTPNGSVKYTTAEPAMRDQFPLSLGSKVFLYSCTFRWWTKWRWLLDDIWENTNTNVHWARPSACVNGGWVGGGGAKVLQIYTYNLPNHLAQQNLTIYSTC